MNSAVDYCFIAFTVVFLFNIIFSVGGQCTVQGCDIDDSPNNCVAQMREVNSQLDMIMTRLEAIDLHVRSLGQDASLQQLKTQQITVLARLETGLQAVETQQDTAMTSLQAVELHLQGQDLYIQSLGELLNASLQQTSLCLDGQEVSKKNQTQISWTQAPENVSGIFNWKVIMNRFNGSVDFNRNWTEYRNGFGDKERGEFWLGNEEVHRLTNSFLCTLRVQVQLKSSGEWYYAEYSSFSLDSESNKYKLRVSGYSGNAGDALTNTSFNSAEYLGGMSFSTWDNDNDRWSDGNCAQSYSSGWWFNACWNTACLTCPYRSNFYWHWSSGWQTSDILRAARMMIRSA